MKTKILSLLLIFVLIFGMLSLGSCSLFPSPEPDPEPTPKPEPEPTPEPTPEPENPGYNPGDWFKPGTEFVPADPPSEYSFRIQRYRLVEFRDKLLSQVDKCIESYGGKFPNAYSTNYLYKPGENTAGWIQGFWPGVLWNAYELSGDVKYKDAAMALVESFAGRSDDDTHDLGFLHSPSCVAAYKLTGDATAKAIALQAADTLIEKRYRADEGFIQAWGVVHEITEENRDDADVVGEYRLIVDTLMNLPLLYWASEETGDPKYKNAANSHLEYATALLWRADGSTYHTYFFDPETGEPRPAVGEWTNPKTGKTHAGGGVTHQGLADGSAWARGQSWAIYGPALAYGYTKDADVLAAFKASANYFIAHLPSDLIPYWDFTYTDGSDEPRDASAAAIAICGLLEGASYLDEDDPDRERYEYYAHKMMEALMTKCAAHDKEGANGLLIGATQNRTTNKGVEEMTPYGDYFFIEALQRMLNEEWTPYW